MTRPKYDRKISIGRTTAKTQLASAPQSQDFVSVAVMPPKFIGASKFVMEEDPNLPTAKELKRAASNAASGSSVSEQGGNRRRLSIWEKMKLKEKQYLASDPNRPPFMIKQVPYDIWRKHYAKDKDGNYHGLSAPAEDCLLKPDDVRKWRLGDETAPADKWTRGSQALPTYAEVEEEGEVPDYSPDPSTEPTWTEEDDAAAAQLEREDSRFLERQQPPHQPPESNRS